MFNTIDKLFINVDGKDMHTGTYDRNSLVNSLTLYAQEHRALLNKFPPMIFYSVLGSILTLPYSDKFDFHNIEQIFLKTESNVIKMVVKFKADNPVKFKAFIMDLVYDKADQFKLAFFSNRELSELLMLMDKKPTDLTLIDLKSALHELKYITCTTQGGIYYTYNSQRIKLDLDKNNFDEEPQLREFISLKKSSAVSWSEKIDLFQSDNPKIVEEKAEHVFTHLALLYHLYSKQFEFVQNEYGIFAFFMGSLHFNFEGTKGFQTTVRLHDDSLLSNDLTILSKNGDEEWFSSRIPIVCTALNNIEWVQNEEFAKDLITNRESPVSLPIAVKTTTDSCILLRFSFPDLNMFTGGNFEKISKNIPVVKSSINTINKEKSTFIQTLADWLITPGGKISPLKNSIQDYIFDIQKILQVETTAQHISSFILGQLLSFTKHKGMKVEKYYYEYGPDFIDEDDDVRSFIIKVDNHKTGVLININEKPETKSPTRHIPPLLQHGLEIVYVVDINLGQINYWSHDMLPLYDQLYMSQVFLYDEKSIEAFSDDDGIFYKLEDVDASAFLSSFLQKQEGRYIKKVNKKKFSYYEKFQFINGVTVPSHFKALVQGILSSKYNTFPLYDKGSQIFMVQHGDKNPVIFRVDYMYGSDITNWKLDLNYKLDMALKYYRKDYADYVKKRHCTLIILTYNEHEAESDVDSISLRHDEVFEDNLSFIKLEASGGLKRKMDRYLKQQQCKVANCQRELMTANDIPAEDNTAVLMKKHTELLEKERSIARESQKLIDVILSNNDMSKSIKFQGVLVDADFKDTENSIQHNRYQEPIVETELEPEVHIIP